MHILSNIVTKIKKLYQQRILSFVTASVILISSCTYFMESTIKILKPKKENRKEDEKVIESANPNDNMISMLSLDLPVPLEEDDSKINVPVIIREDTINKIITNVGKRISEDYFISKVFDNNEKFNQVLDDTITIQLMKMGLIDKEVTNDEKIAWILKHYELTMEEFKVIVGVVLAEAKGDSYEDAYAVINTIYNRTISLSWIKDIERYQEEGTGTNPYNQVIQRGQFSVYGSGSYLLFMDATPENNPGMQAVIDFLYGEFTYDFDNYKITWSGPARLHNYLGFRSNGSELAYYEQFTISGNKFISNMTDDDYASNLFTDISEKEVEQKAIDIESLTDDYRSLINSGASREEAIKLVREKSN